MNSLIVTATRWSGGWELEIGEQQHTQVRNLCNARQQVVGRRAFEALGDGVRLHGVLHRVFGDAHDATSTGNRSRPACRAMGRPCI